MPLSAVKPDQYDALLAAKVERACALFAPFAAPEPEVYASAPLGFRLRAEFRMWHEGDALDYVMFRRDDRSTPVAISAFPIAHEAIQAIMPPLRSALACEPVLRRKLFQVEFMSTLAGELMITLVYHRPLDEAWEVAAQTLRTLLAQDHGQISLIGRSRKQKIVLGRDWIEEAFSIEGTRYRYRQYEQAFTQPNGQVNTAMITWACQRAAEGDGGDLLELYCGNGNFTLPLSRHFNAVIATEVAKTSTRAARENIAANAVDNVQLVRLSAEEVTQAINGDRVFRRLAELPRPLGEYSFNTLFVDPPRAGLDPHTTAMAAEFERVIYISCNPDTLAANLEVLGRSHMISHFALFDQFPYTEHMECGVALARRN